MLSLSQARVASAGNTLRDGTGLYSLTAGEPARGLGCHGADKVQ